MFSIVNTTSVAALHTLSHRTCYTAVNDDYHFTRMTAPQTDTTPGFHRTLYDTRNQVQYMYLKPTSNVRVAGRCDTPRMTR